MKCCKQCGTEKNCEECTAIIDVGDHVLHQPTGEEWIVAGVDGGHLYWCGYPFGGNADLSDCTLIEKADEEYRNDLLRELAKHSSDITPARLAKVRLSKDV